MTISRLLLALPLLALVWLATLALVARVAGAQAVIVPFPPAGLVARLEDAALTGASRYSLSLRSDAPGLVARAYAAGAWLVLPAGLSSCIPAAQP
jgi:hypothetical protein